MFAVCQHGSMAYSWGRGQLTMLACGHNLHMTCLMATATLVKKAKAKVKWVCIVILVFQPNEEHTMAPRPCLKA